MSVDTKLKVQIMIAPFNHPNDSGEQGHGKLTLQINSWWKTKGISRFGKTQEKKEFSWEGIFYVIIELILLCIENEKVLWFSIFQNLLHLLSDEWCPFIHLLLLNSLNVHYIALIYMCVKINFYCMINLVYSFFLC